MPFGARNNKKVKKVKRLTKKDKPLNWGLNILEKSVNFRPYFVYRDHICNECDTCDNCEKCDEYGSCSLDNGGCSSGYCGIPLPLPLPQPSPPPRGCSCGVPSHPYPPSGCSSGACGIQRPRHHQPNPHLGCWGGQGSTPAKCGYYNANCDNYGYDSSDGIYNAYNAYNINMSSNISNNNNHVHSYLDKYLI